MGLMLPFLSLLSLSVLSCLWTSGWRIYSKKQGSSVNKKLFSCDGIFYISNSYERVKLCIHLIRDWNLLDGTDCLISHSPFVF